MKHPFVDTAIPLAYGDNYMGYKIVGTTEDYIHKFDGVLAEGKSNEKDFEVVIGANIASNLDLKIGDTFYGSHGDVNAEVHEDHPYTIVGILAPTGQLIDNIIVSNISSVWHIHEHEHDEEMIADDHHHEESDVHDHDHEEEHE